jgi:hypothetical protein
MGHLGVTHEYPNLLSFAMDNHVQIAGAIDFLAGGRELGQFSELGGERRHARYREGLVAC